MKMNGETCVISEPSYDRRHSNSPWFCGRNRSLTAISTVLSSSGHFFASRMAFTNSGRQMIRAMMAGFVPARLRYRSPVYR